MTLAQGTIGARIRMLAAGLLLCLAIPAAPAQGAADEPRDRFVITGPVVVDRDETAGDVAVADGDVLVRGTVDGDLFVVNGEVTLRGRVTGDVVAIAGPVVLGQRGRIDGDLRYGDKRPQGATPAKVGGDVKRFDPESIGAPLGAGIAIGLWLAVTLSAFLLGLLLLLLAPRAAEAVARVGRQSPGKSLLIGLLAFIVLPIVGLVALVTIVGIPLGAVLLLALVPLYAIAYTTSAWVLGRRILGTDRARILAFLGGLVILRLLALIPFVGGIVWLLATLLGLGALALAIGRARTA